MEMLLALITLGTILALLLYTGWTVGHSRAGAALGETLNRRS